MKLIKKEIAAKDGEGYIELMPEIDEDLWHLYHIIAIGDRVRATTIRKVSKESNTGLVSNEKVKITITIAVEKIDFDPKGKSFRISGKNVTENQYIKLGQYHTFDLELNRKLSISKARWDQVFLDRIEESIDMTKNSDLAAVIMSEGKAHLCLISQHMTIEKQKIEKSISKKRYAESHESDLNKFFDAIIRGIQQHVNFDIVKCVLLASPGFTNEQFLEYMNKIAQQKDLKDLLANKDKFVCVHSNTGHLHGLKEVLQDESVLKKLSDTKAVKEVKALEEFYNMLSVDQNRAVYGPNHVMKAAEQNAIDLLLITDELFRSSDLKQRIGYVKLCENVQSTGGKVVMFSGMHVAGTQLSQMTGVAAILRFPMTFEDVESEDESSDESDGDDQA
ncbi:hypothetical protein FDP41_008373 [Naegleria fowleri]|uniref:Protein pelota homolog n=1 Tax=Naegleria fowleri TaxID=5763 RepID=A0A6A5BEY5_NAEFO|nr:uncharacterized protein FDP41_008373 [Naegleria fowleri]KAF0973166.1 hypothetical protein FDP41_008373 [Naegleria fowleri]